MPTSAQIATANTNLVGYYQTRLGRFPTAAWTNELLVSVAPLWTSSTAPRRPRDPVEASDAPPAVIGFSEVGLSSSDPSLLGSTSYSSAMGTRIRTDAGAPSRSSWPTGTALSVAQSVTNLSSWLTARLATVPAAAYTDSLVTDLTALSSWQTAITNQALSFAMAAMSLATTTMTSSSYSASTGARQRAEQP